jgi:hypothetical protein
MTENDREVTSSAPEEPAEAKSPQEDPKPASGDKKRVRYNGASGASVEAAGFTWNVDAPDDHEYSSVKDVDSKIAEILTHEHSAMFYYED